MTTSNGTWSAWTSHVLTNRLCRGIENPFYAFVCTIIANYITRFVTIIIICFDVYFEGLFLLFIINITANLITCCFAAYLKCHTLNIQTSGLPHIYYNYWEHYRELEGRKVWVFTLEPKLIVPKYMHKRCKCAHYPCYTIPYGGNLSRVKTFTNCRKQPPVRIFATFQIAPKPKFAKLWKIPAKR